MLFHNQYKKYQVSASDKSCLYKVLEPLHLEMSLCKNYRSFTVKHCKHLRLQPAAGSCVVMHDPIHTCIFFAKTFHRALLTSTINYTCTWIHFFLF